jgi:hypothetical protein
MEYQTLASGWFKQKHLKLNIWQVKGLEVYIA